MDTVRDQSNCERNGMPQAVDGLRAGNGSARRCGNIAAPGETADPFRATIAYREKSTRVPREDIIFRRDVMIFRGDDNINRNDVIVFRCDHNTNRRDVIVFRGDDNINRGDVIVFRCDDDINRREVIIFRCEDDINRGDVILFRGDASVFSDAPNVFRDASGAAFHASAILRGARDGVSSWHRARRVDPRDRAGMSRRGTTHGARAHAKNPAPGVRSAVFG